MSKGKSPTLSIEDGSFFFFLLGGFVQNINLPNKRAL